MTMVAVITAVCVGNAAAISVKLGAAQRESDDEKETPVAK
jgi:hypothetical protein